MARVNVEEEAFADPRIELLGQLAGYNRFEALGRMTHLWRVCTQRQTHTLPAAIIDACLGIGSHEHLVSSELGEWDGDAIRIRGTYGRIEWYEATAEKRRRGGKARAAGAARDDRGRLIAASSTIQHNARSSDSRRDASSSTPANVQLTSSKPPAPVQHITSKSSSDAPANPASLTLALALTPGDLDQDHRLDLAPVRETRAPRAASRRKPSIPIPGGWVAPVSDKTPSGLDLALEEQKFRNHAAANDRRCADWNAAWRNWLLNAAKYQGRGPPGKPGLAVGRVEPARPEDYAFNPLEEQPP
jgi:hypothetical protein